MKEPGLFNEGRLNILKNNIKIVICPSCKCRYKASEEFVGRKISCKKCGTLFEIAFEDLNEQKEVQQVSSTPQEETGEISQEDSYLVIGRLAMKHKFINKQQIREALAIQEREKRKGKRLLFGQILVSHGMIVPAQLDFLLSIQKMVEVRKLDHKFGLIAVKNGFAGEDEIDQALEKQKQIFKETKTVKSIGDLLVESGTLTELKRDAVLLGQERIEKSIYDAGKRPELVGKTEQLEGNAEFELSISEDRLSAFIAPKAEVSELITIESIKKFLKINEITYGIVDDSVISTYLKEENSQNKPWKIAEGNVPELEKEAIVKYYFETDLLKVETIKDDGVIDFKNRGELPRVRKGELLAEIISGAEGTSGVDVYGHPIPVPKFGDTKLLYGKGATISEDGSKVFAATDGIPIVSVRGKVRVHSQLDISGDVDLETGDVDFDGNIHVTGTIQSGFRVKGASLTANEILQSEIEISGDTVVLGGIKGATIKTSGNIRARFINDSDIEAFGDIVVEKEIIDSIIKVSGACFVKGGTLLSSSIKAKKGIWAMQIGSDSSRRCSLMVGVDVNAKNEIGRKKEAISIVNDDLKKSGKRIKELKMALKKIEENIGEALQVQDGAMVSQRNILDKLKEYRKENNLSRLAETEKMIDELNSKIKKGEEHLDELFNRQDQNSEEISNIQQKIKGSEVQINELQDMITEITEWSTTEKGVPQVRVNGTIFQDTIIQGINSSLTIPRNYKKVFIQELQKTSPEDVLEWHISISRLE